MPDSPAVRPATNSDGTPVPATAGPAGGRIYRVGTLTYTRSKLLQVMFWMLWGDFFFILMEALVPTIVPLQLRWEGASDMTIGLLGSSLSAVLGLFLFPVVGVQSDRHRGRLGRRRPFLLWCTPPVVISLVLLGAAKPVGVMLHQVLSLLGGGSFLTIAGCTIAWIALCTVLFVFFNIYVASVYQYMFADVIPAEVMGKFYGLFRAVSAVGGVVFNRWLLGYVELYTLHIYVLLALLYAIAFYMLIWKVKEGEYPPPAPKSPGGGWGALKTYCRECFTHPFYLNYYCLNLCLSSALVPLSYLVFFGTEAGQEGYAPTLGLSLQAFGQVKGWTYLVQIPVFFLTGPLVDRFHPSRVSMVALALTSLSFFCCYWLIHDASSLLLWWCVNQGALAIQLACASYSPRILPREKYGQYLSAGSWASYIGMVLAPLVVGYLLGVLRDYRYVYIFSGVGFGCGFLASVGLFLQWKKLGGDLHYKAPEPWVKQPAAVPPTGK